MNKCYIPEGYRPPLDTRNPHAKRKGHTIYHSKKDDFPPNKHYAHATFYDAYYKKYQSQNSVYCDNRVISLLENQLLPHGYSKKRTNSTHVTLPE